MAVAPGDVFTLIASGEIYGQRVMLTHGYIVTNVVGTVTESAAADALVTEVRGGVGGGDVIETAYRNCLPPEYQLNYWQAQIIRPIRLAYRRTTRSVPGLHAGSTEATNQSVALTLKSDFAGRWAQSVKKIGPIPQDATVQDNGLITNAYKTLIETFGATLLTPISDLGVTWQPCIIHPPAEHLGTTPLLTQSIALELRTMRRRSVRVGE